MIEIRKATTNDMAVLLDFQLRLAWETENIQLDRTVVMNGLQALIDDPSKGIYYVAEMHGEIIGCQLVTFEWSEWRNGTVWWIQSVYVKESHRQQKVFSVLYNYIKQFAENDASVLGLRLYVDKSNKRAQKVYQSLGMDGDHYTVFEWMKQ